MASPARVRRSRGSGAAVEAAASAAGMATLPGKSALHGDARAAACAAPWDWSRSVDLDAGLRAFDPNAARWDAGLGLYRVDASPEEMVIWVEPHPASSTGNVADVLRKLEWLKARLREPAFSGFRELTRVALRHGPAYRWLARTGAIRVRAGTREQRLLVKAGLGMPQRHLLLP